MAHVLGRRDPTPKPTVVKVVRRSRAIVLSEFKTRDRLLVAETAGKKYDVLQPPRTHPFAELNDGISMEHELVAL